MKLLNGTIASLVPLTALGLVVHPAAAAPIDTDEQARTVKVTLSGDMELNDSEPFGGDEHRKVAIAANEILSNAAPNGIIVIKKCVGDEVRGELHVRFKLLSSGRIQVKPVLKLYEGVDCDTKDLDGQKSIKTRVFKGILRDVKGTAWNEKENIRGDYVKVRFDLVRV